MKYIRVKWFHFIKTEPVLLYSELDDNRWETRKIEVYADGRCDFANAYKSVGNARLGKEPLPSLHDIALDPEFEPVEISQNEFEQLWVEAHTTNQLRLIVPVDMFGTLLNK